MESRTSMVSQKNVTVKTLRESRVSIGFSCTVSEIQNTAYKKKFRILVIPVLLAHEKSYKHGFTKKYDGRKFCAKSRAESSFDLFFVHRLKNLKYWPFPTY
ncbi:hypothetical protein BHM03_00042625 [Ensete ventricosum]|nr:hypothetical protein BHM03_00042625 [Ensete ventricosum]